MSEPWEPDGAGTGQLQGVGRAVGRVKGRGLLKVSIADSDLLELF